VSFYHGIPFEIILGNSVCKVFVGTMWVAVYGGILHQGLIAFYKEKKLQSFSSYSISIIVLPLL
jgi:hypothetical protein